MRDRATLALSLALLTGLAGGSYWLAERARLADAAAHKPTHDPDYFAEHFALTRMDENGTALYATSADKLFHFPDDDSTTMVSPVMTSSRADRPHTHIRADSGVSTSDADEVRLSGDVRILRDATDTDAALEARTSFLLMIPDDDIARTDRPVQVTHGGSTVWAQSMEFDNTDRFLKINPSTEGRGSAIIEPHHAPASKAAPKA